jgi:hypothetical protein
MTSTLLVSPLPAWLLIILVIVLAYVAGKRVQARGPYRRAGEELASEGILRRKRCARIGVSFPLIHRTTLVQVILSRKRIMLFHVLTNAMILQAPTGASGQAGKETGRFEVERRWAGTSLTFKTTVKGGGRVRIYLRDAQAWLEDIRASG